MLIQQQRHINGTIIVWKLTSLVFLFSIQAFALPPQTMSGATIGTATGVVKTTSGVVSSNATTADLSELTNLYYTDARVTSAASAAMPVQQMYVTKDRGNDANDCSLLKPCKTIQAGINAANLISAYYKPVIIHVAPSFGGTGSSYNENITFSQQGVNLVCDVTQQSQRACQISGTVTVNMTGISGGANFVAASNEAYMNGFVVGVNSAGATFTFSGATYQRFILLNSYIDQNGSGNAIVMSNSGTSGGSPSLLKVFDSDINNSNATSPAVDLQAGRFWLYGTTTTISNGNASGPSVTQSGATSSFIANLVQLTGQYNLTSNTATATFNLSTITSGTNPCIVTPASPNTGYALLASFGCNSSNTNSITGTGVVANGPGNARFGSSGDIISTVTQASIGPGLPQGELMLGPGATTGTNVLLSIKDGHIKSANTTAPTRTLSGNAGTGGSPSCTLTNASDTAGKIALVTGTSAWASGTQCTVTFNKAYGVAPICIFSANNASAASKAVSQQINFTTTTTTMLVSFGAADSAQTTYNWMYHCVETQ